MKKLIKFKNYKQTESISSVHSLLFYNLKRTKWVNIQNRLIKASSRKNRTRVKFLNLNRVKREVKVWGRISAKRQQHSSLLKKISMSHVNFLPRKFYGNNPKTYKLCLLKNVVKVLLKLELLLWVSGLFVSPQYARMQLLSGNVYLNNNKISHSVFLKQNDIIRHVKPKLNVEKFINFSNFFLTAAIMKIRKLTSKKYTLKKKKRKFKLKTFFFQYKKKYSLSLSKINKVLVLKKKKFVFLSHVLSFLEIDLYSKSIIVVKDLSSMSSLESCLACKEYFDMQQI